jgi:hypothetical protein
MVEEPMYLGEGGAETVEALTYLGRLKRMKAIDVGTGWPGEEPRYLGGKGGASAQNTGCGRAHIP